MVQFTNEIEENLPNVEIDVGQIQQVLMNLLANAADAIAERSASLGDQAETFTRRIGIATHYDADKEMLEIRLSDNGTGMSEETLNKLFTLHFSTKKGGHGLGLHNCRKIVELHQGNISVESTEGEGTTFTIVLPRFQPAKKEMQQANDTGSSPSPLSAD
jgi:signal transduction histidine kinase